MEKFCPQPSEQSLTSWKAGSFKAIRKPKNSQTNKNITCSKISLSNILNFSNALILLRKHAFAFECFFDVFFLCFFPMLIFSNLIVLFIEWISVFQHFVMKQVYFTVAIKQLSVFLNAVQSRIPGYTMRFCNTCLKILKAFHKTWSLKKIKNQACKYEVEINQMRRLKSLIQLRFQLLNIDLRCHLCKRTCQIDFSTAKLNTNLCIK